MIPNVEDAKVIEVGKAYNVPCVKAGAGSTFAGAVLPILGELHDDSEYEIFFGLHVHLDWRFIAPPVFWDTLMAAAEVFGGVDPRTPNVDLAAVIPESGIVGAPQRRAMKCERLHSRWAVGPPWLTGLERAYREKRVCANRCPHRGFSLAGAPEDENGNRVCPGHALQWDRNGALVPRALEGK